MGIFDLLDKFSKGELSGSDFSKSLEEVDSLEKAKYKRRWKGKDGKWQYEYDEPQSAKPMTWKEEKQIIIQKIGSLDSHIEAKVSGVSEEFKRLARKYGDVPKTDESTVRGLRDANGALTPRGRELQDVIDDWHDDVADESRRMKMAKKSLPPSRPFLRESTGPDAQREMTAYDRAKVERAYRAGPPAVSITTLRKAKAPESDLEKSNPENQRVYTQGPDSAVTYELTADEQYAELAKSGVTEVPTITKNSALGRIVNVCKSCETHFAKSITVCPECGDGPAGGFQVVNTIAETATVEPRKLHGPTGLRSAHQPVKINFRDE